MITSSEMVVAELDGCTKALHFEMYNKMSAHPRARFICEVSQGFNVAETFGYGAVIQIEKRDTRETIFSGCVENITLEERQPGYFVLDLTLIGGSILLDQKRKCRSYQDVSNKHQDIIEKVAHDTAEVTVDCELTGDKAIGKPLIQYEETDWEFINRVASRLNEPTYADESMQVPYVYVGSKRIGAGQDIVATLVGEGMSSRFYRLGELAEKNGCSAYYFYKVTGADNYGMGEQVVYNGSLFHVGEKEAHIESEELLYTYTLVGENYLKIPQIYNPRLTGASVLGNIMQVSGETVELKLNLREEADSSVFYAYDWKPEVGNLMYCMPKIGTTVSLYFPSHDEQEAYAVNCVRRVGEAQERLFDETAKSFLTENGKMMVMASSAMHLCAVNQGDDTQCAQLSMVDTLPTGMADVSMAQVSVDDIFEKMGMLLYSSHDIQVNATSILFHAPYVDLFVGGKICVMTGAAAISGRANASIVLAAAYFSMTADGMVRFVLCGRSGDNSFCVIWDEPEKGSVADTAKLIRNILIGVAVVAVVAAFCLFALPVMLGAAGVAAATASSIAMGAAVGATVTGTFAVYDQYKNDKERGEASTIPQTLTNIGLKTVAGAAEGGFMSAFGGTKLMAEGAKFFTRQTFKNFVRISLVNQTGNFISKSGDVAAGLLCAAEGGEAYTGKDVMEAYANGAIMGAVGGVFDSIKGIPAVERASKRVTDYLAKKSGIANWLKKYGDVDSFGQAKAAEDYNIRQAKSRLEDVSKPLNTLNSTSEKVSRDVADVEKRLTNLNTKYANMFAEHPEKDPGYFRSQIGKTQRNLQELKDRVAKIDLEIAVQTQLESNLKSTIQRSQEANYKLIWNTLAACSVKKAFENGINREIEEKIGLQNR